MSVENKYQVEALSISRVTVPSTAGGTTLETMSVAINPQAHRISLQAVGADVYVSDVNGSADANSFVLFQNGSITLDVGINMARRLKFYTAGGTTMNVLQQGDI